MNVRKTLVNILAASALVGTGAVYAQGSGWYGGAGFGRSSMDIEGADVDALAAAEGLTTTTSVDDSDTAWKIFGGYRLMENFAVELGYVDYGTVTARSLITAPVAGRFNIDLDVTSWNVDAVGILPVGTGFELFGKLGIAVWEADGSISVVAGGNALATSADDDGNDLHFGIGARYLFSDAFGVRAEWERIRDDQDLDTWMLGAEFRF